MAQDGGRVLLRQGAMLQKALHEKEPRLVHSESNESLFQELQQVVQAEPAMVSKAIASRTKGDRKEIARLLGHLPMIREYREHSHGRALSSRSQGSSGQGPMSARYVPRPPMARKQAWEEPPKSARATNRPTSRQEDVVDRRPPTPRPRTPRTPRTPSRRPATPRQETQEAPRRPRSAAGFLMEAPAERLEVHSGDQSPTDRPPDRINVQDEAWYQQALKTAAASARLGFAAMPLEDEVPLKKDREEAEARKRYLGKLAEVGIDPEGMTAGDILRLLYARDSSTTYKRMNKEAQKKLLVRVRTPLCMRTVLKERAVQEVKAARDKPAELVHECLDRWEIENLAEVCRSLKFFDEEAAGQVSTYLRSYGRRQYLESYNRKAYVRPPTA
mmetsp:Transcript_43382/g.94265  ORF Transcript_43382/g.94265 Transcript_43382/m.94265 type:complete len:387 (-) Transcript_43382:37-1197(-)